MRAKTDRCVALARQPGKCKHATNVAAVAVNLEPEVNLEGYSIRTAYSVKTPNMQQQKCDQRDRHKKYLKDVMQGEVSADDAVKFVRKLHTAIARVVAFELYEEPHFEDLTTAGKSRMAAWGSSGSGQNGSLPCLRAANPP